MNYEWAKLGLEIFSLLMSCAAIIFTYVRTNDKESAEMKQGFIKELSDKEVRLQRLEERSQHVPTRKELHELSASIAGMQSTVKATGENVTAMRRQLELINEHLLNRS